MGIRDCRVCLALHVCVHVRACVCVHVQAPRPQAVYTQTHTIVFSGRRQLFGSRAIPHIRLVAPLSRENRRKLNGRDNKGPVRMYTRLDSIASPPSSSSLSLFPSHPACCTMHATYQARDATLLWTLFCDFPRVTRPSTIRDKRLC